MRSKGIFCLTLLLLCAIGTAVPAMAQRDAACNAFSRTLSVNWPQFGFTSCGARSNPNEFILSPNTVKNLEVKWQYVIRSYAGGASPAVMNGVLYVDAYSQNEGVDYLYALDANSGAQLWYQPKGKQSTSSPAVANGMVFIGDLDNNLYAFDARTGAPAWKFTTGNTVWGSPTVANGVVYITSSDGTTHALDAASGTQLWAHGGGGLFVSGTPAVAGSTVYTTSDSGGVGLYALDAQTGALRWSLNQNSMQTGSPAVANSIVYAGMDDGSLYALAAGTGAIRWTSPFLGRSMRGVAVGNGLVYVGATDGNNNPALYGINASTGAIVWKFLTGGIGVNASSPTYANGVVYMPGGVGIYALDANTGAVLWQDLGPANPGASPVVVNGVLYINGTGPTAYHLPAQ